MPPASAPQAKWYSVCGCGAKIYHPEQTAECPRCGQQVTSEEQIVPPWDRRLLTVKEVAERLNHKDTTVRSLINSGKLGHHRCPGIRVSEEQLAAYLEETKREGEEQKSRKPKPSPPRLRCVRL